MVADAGGRSRPHPSLLSWLVHILGGQPGPPGCGAPAAVDCAWTDTATWVGSEQKCGWVLLGGLGGRSIIMGIEQAPGDDCMVLPEL